MRIAYDSLAVVAHFHARDQVGGNRIVRADVFGAHNADERDALRFAVDAHKPRPSMRSVLLGRTSLTITESVVVNVPERVVEPVPLPDRELLAVNARSRKNRCTNPVPPNVLTESSWAVLVVAVDCALVLSATVMVRMSPALWARVSVNSDAALALLLPRRALVACSVGNSESARALTGMAQIFAAHKSNNPAIA